MFTVKDIQNRIYLVDNFLIKRRLRDEYNKYYIAEGSSRIVMYLDDNFVIKISKDILSEPQHSLNTGTIQSLKEIEVWKKCPSEYRYLLNPIIKYGVCMGHLYIIQEKVECVEDYYDYSTEMSQICEDYGSYFLEEDLDDLCDTFGLMKDDIYNAACNLGINSNNEIVIIDYGFIGW